MDDDDATDAAAMLGGTAERCRHEWAYYDDICGQCVTCGAVEHYDVVLRDLRAQLSAAESMWDAARDVAIREAAAVARAWGMTCSRAPLPETLESGISAVTAFDVEKRILAILTPPTRSDARRIATQRGEPMPVFDAVATPPPAETEATVAQLLGALEALVAETAGECSAPKSEVGPSTRAAEDDEPLCLRPARWGVLTAWSCDEHRRPRDKKEIGGPALLSAFRILSAARDKGRKDVRAPRIGG